MTTQASNFSEPHFGNIPLACVIPSKTNPRKHFDEISIAELAESIKQHGVAQPILVRPLPTTEDMIDCVEIVAGERRYRASKLAGLESIPAIVRELTDVQALEIQVIENLQRQDVHPIEEAEGYHQLMKLHNYTADQLAEKVGKSRSYIYGRLKFCALAPAAREAFFDGKLSASTALLVARIPVESLQEHATEELANDGDPLSYRAAVEHIQDRYMLKLDRARFSIADAKLVKAAGSCEACTKRTGNQPILFKDVDANICTDPNCFASKSRAHDDKTLAVAQKKGIPVYEGEEAEKFVRETKLVSPEKPLYHFERRVDNHDYQTKVADRLPPEQLPEPTAFVRIDGKVQPMFEKTSMQEALEKSGLCMTLEQHNQAVEEKLSGAGRPEGGNAGPSQKEIERQAQLAEINRKVHTENSIRLAIYKGVRAYADTGVGTPMLRVLTKLLLNQFPLPSDVLSDLYSFDTSTDEAIASHIDARSTLPNEIDQILMDLLIGESLTVSSWELEHEDPEDNGTYRALLDLAEIAGIDADGIRDEHESMPETIEGVEGTRPDDAEPGEQIDGAGLKPFAGGLEPRIGDRVRIGNDVRGPNGKLRKCCGREGTIESIDDAYYTVRTGPNAHELMAGLVENEFTKIQDEEPPIDTSAPAPKKVQRKTAKSKAAPAEDKTRVLSPEAAWPFPTGARP